MTNEGMRAYSQDLQQRILHAVDQGKPRAEILKTFEASRATIKRYLKRRRESQAISEHRSKKGAFGKSSHPPHFNVEFDSRAISILIYTKLSGSWWNGLSFVPNSDTGIR